MSFQNYFFQVTLCISILLSLTVFILLLAEVFLFYCSSQRRFCHLELSTNFCEFGLEICLTDLDVTNSLTFSQIIPPTSLTVCYTVFAHLFNRHETKLSLISLFMAVGSIDGQVPTVHAGDDHNEYRSDHRYHQRPCKNFALELFERS